MVKRKTKSKIFGIGLSKTATTSLYWALSELGYKTGHFDDSARLTLHQWFLGDFTSIDYLEAFDAMADLPMGTYFKELDTLYPGSKFILTLRPIDSWLNSTKLLFQQRSDLSQFRIFVRLTTYGIIFFNEKRFKNIYYQHCENVISHFKNRPDDLLIMNMFNGDGWKELCAFLNKEIPDTEFPNAKSTERWGEKFQPRL
jgi:hypothetical protein